MIIDIDYLENQILMLDDYIINLEVENKKYFYRLVKDFYDLSSGNEIDAIKFFVNGKEENITEKVSIFTNYFVFDEKKYSLSINKYLINAINEQDKELLIKEYHQLVKKYNNVIDKVDLPVTIDYDIGIEKIIKLIKVDINFTNELLNNLLIILDIERELSINKILIFVNLKQYLTKEELNELYKYSLYTNVKIILIDSQSYGICQNYEKKYIIDENLVEFVV